MNCVFAEFLDANGAEGVHARVQQEKVSAPDERLEADGTLPVSDVQHV